MKKLKKGMAFLTVFVFALCLNMSLFAASGNPQIVLKENGVKNQYDVYLENLGTEFHSVQFQIQVKSSAEAEMDWENQEESSFQRMDADSNGSSTTLTFYYDRVESTITNSGSAFLGSLTFEKAPSSNDFVSNSSLKALDDKQKETNYDRISLVVQKSGSSSGSSSGTGGQGGYDAVDDDDDDDDDDNTSSSRRRDPSDNQTESSSQGTLTWEAVSKDVTTENGVQTLQVDISQGQQIQASFLQEILSRKIKLTLDYGKYQWIVDGSKGGSIPENRLYYDLSVADIYYPNLTLAAGDTDIAQFDITHSGSLPFSAVLVYFVGTEYSGQTLYLGYYNESNGTLEYKGSGVVDAEGRVSFSFEHASKYIITTKNIWAKSGNSNMTQVQTNSNIPAGSGGQQAGGTGSSSGGSNNADANTETILVPPADKPAVTEEETVGSSSVPEQNETEKSSGQLGQPTQDTVSPAADEGNSAVIVWVVLGILFIGVIAAVVIVFIRKK